MTRSCTPPYNSEIHIVVYFQENDKSNHLIIREIRKQNNRDVNTECLLRLAGAAIVELGDRWQGRKGLGHPLGGDGDLVLQPSTDLLFKGGGAELGDDHQNFILRIFSFMIPEQQ